MPAALHLLVSHRRWLGEPPPRRSDCVSPRRASGPLGLEARSGPARGRVRPRRPAPSPRVPRSLASPCGGLYATCGAQTGGVRPPPPGSRACRAPLRGGASHEAEGRRGARGSGVGRVGPPPGWPRLRQIGDQLVPGVEQFLLVDDVVAIEDGAALVPGQEHGDAFGDVRTDQITGGGAPAIMEEAGRYGVVARIVTGPHDAHRQDPHLSRRYDTGRPRADPIEAHSRGRSLPCPAGPGQSPVSEDVFLSSRWVAIYWDYRGILARMFRCATRSSCWCT